MNSPLKSIRVVKVEERPRDAWLDMSLRQLREGEVRFYNVKDPVTGRWLFKVCPDEELHRAIVKALKCPPGKTFAQLEGSTMLFQRSPKLEGLYYGVVSVSYIDENGRLRRNVVESLEEVPKVVRENFEIKTYEEAVGKKAPGKRLVVLCREGDEKAMITLFLLERAWPVSEIKPELALLSRKILTLVKRLERASIDDLYEKAEGKYGLSRETVDDLLSILEREKEILRLGDGYVKSRS